MKAARLTANILFTLFLIICIAWHVVALAMHLENDPVYVHLVFLVCYGICLLALLRPIKYRTIIYCLAAIYPFYYHAHCAWVSYTVHDKFNTICILVVVEMPLIALWIWKQKDLDKLIAQ
jgi:hypothetical protein